MWLVVLSFVTSTVGGLFEVLIEIFKVAQETVTCFPSTVKENGWLNPLHGFENFNQDVYSSIALCLQHVTCFFYFK